MKDKLVPSGTKAMELIALPRDLHDVENPEAAFDEKELNP